MKQILYFILITLCLISCTRKVDTRFQPAEGNKYAAGFRLQDSADCCIATVFSPWDRTQVMARYVLSNSNADAMPVVRRMAVTSCTHVGMLAALGRLDCLVGVCQPSLVYTDLSTCPSATEPTFDVGDGMNPSVERLLMTHPDAVMLSIFAADDPVSKRLEKLGVRVIYNNEWMESHPLARAEWIRLIGAFVGRRNEADSIFCSVVANYKTLCAEARYRQEKRKSPPSIFSGQDFRGTWYVPSGDTYMGTLFADAGASYAYADDHHEGSVPLTMEQALQVFADADVWVGVNARTMDELRQASEKHTWLKAYKTGRVFNFLKRSTPDGANDFWERGVVHPEEILSDLIEVLYPQKKSVKLYYTEPLQNK